MHRASRALSTSSSSSRAIIDTSMPSYSARHLENAAELMSSSQHNSGTTNSVSIRLIALMIWLSVNHNFFAL
jgi:hypothetical protein